MGVMRIFVEILRLENNCILLFLSDPGLNFARFKLYSCRQCFKLSLFLDLF